MNPTDISIYVILDPEHVQHGLSPLAVLEQAIDGGATMIQYRDKHSSTRDMIEFARQARALMAPYRVPLIINDRVDVALAAKADGVHVGNDDMTLQDVHRLMPEKSVIGVTIHNEKEALATDTTLASYAGIGPYKVSGSKPSANEPTGPLGLKSLRKIIPDLPVCAIGGITMNDCASIRHAGADGIAVIGAVLAQPDIKAAVQQLKMSWQDAAVLGREEI